MDYRGKIVSVDAKKVVITNSVRNIEYLIEKSVFMLGKCYLPLSLISENLEVTVSLNDGKAYICIEPSKNLYIVHIYELKKS